MGEASTPTIISSSSSPEVLRVLQALKQASQDLHSHPSTPADDDDSSIKALLELETESDAILSNDPHLSALSTLLTHLKSAVQTLRNARGSRNINSFFARRFSTLSISKLAGSIEGEIQSWIDRESVERVARALHVTDVNGGEEDDEDQVENLIAMFENRVSDGFSHELQDLILKWKVFQGLEMALCDSKSGKRVKEQSAMAIAALIRFNKDVFVGEVLMGGSVEALLNMSNTCSIKVLTELIRRIKSPLVDELESQSKLPKIISFLDSDDMDLKLAAMDCILEIGYCGRREAIEGMIKEGGLVEKLVEFQRSELGGDLIEMDKCDSDSDEGSDGKGASVQEVYGSSSSRRERRYLLRRPFASCVARFAVQLEVGEGLRHRERRAFKQEILVRVKKASLSDAEAATIIAEVLWGSSP